MYSLTRLIPWQRLLSEQVPVISIALCIAEVFYKFHSFILETTAFMATWYVLDAVLQRLIRLVNPDPTRVP